MKLDTFTNLFMEFEYENNMFEKQIDNVYYWKYVRFIIVYDLYKYFGLSSESLNCKYQKKYKYSISERIQINIKKNPKFWEKRDILIIPHERKYERENGDSRCIYTNAIDQDLKISHYVLDSKCIEGYYKKQKSKNIIYEDMDGQFPYTPEKKIKYTKPIFEKEVLIPIEQYFQIKISIEDKNKWISSINTYLNMRAKYENYYKHVLDIICPKVIIITVGYSFNRMILCEVAKKKGIPVIELQHGEITKTHIAYNYFQAYKNLAIPDYLFCYGELERKEEVKFPINKENIIPVGFPELERMSKKRKKEDYKIKIMFVSQVNQIIAQYAKSLDEILDSEKYEIIYKLHPKEYDDWRERYGDIFENSSVKVVGSFKETIYEWLKKVDWVIGIYSTVLLEATMFDVNIVVLKEELYESIPDLYEKGYAILVDSPIELATVIKEKKYKLRNKEENIFFKKNSINNMLQEIEKIIEKHSG